MLCFLFISIRTAEFLQQYLTEGLPPASRWLSSGENELPADRVPASDDFVLNAVSQVVGGGDHWGSYDAQRCVGEVQSSAGTVRVVCEPASRVSICLPVRVPASCQTGIRAEAWIRLHLLPFPSW